MLVFTTAVAVVLVVSFLCSILESVLLSINHAQIKALATKHGRAGRLLAGFKREIDVPIAAILIVNTAAHTVGASVAGASYQQVFGGQTLWLFTIVFTLAVLLLTEIVPKTLGVTFSRVLARPVAHGIFALTVILRPLVRLSSRISQALRGDKESPITSIEEIRLLAALGRSEGVVGVQTASMIVGASRLLKLTAANVMVPRTELTFLSATQSTESILDTLKKSGYSRFPFSYTGELDEVSGTVFARELLFWLHDNPGREIDWTELVHEPLIVPERKQLNKLLSTFQQANKHQALVVDEYGDLQGLATLEDVLEEIVGEIFDESDPVIEDFWPQQDGSLHVRAKVDLRRLCDQLNLEWSAETAAISLGGLLADSLGRVPLKGDTVEWRGFTFKVLAASDRRARLVEITRVKRQ